MKRLSTETLWKYFIENICSVTLSGLLLGKLLDILEEYLKHDVLCSSTILARSYVIYTQISRSVSVAKIGPFFQCDILT